MSTLQVINHKLTEDNYRYWRAQVLYTIVGPFDLDEQLPVVIACPSPFVIVENDACENIVKKLNLDYHRLKKLNKLLMSRLVASISQSMFSHIARCSSAYEIWITMENFLIAE